MMLNFADFIDRLDYIVCIVNLKESEEKFWEFAHDIIHRYRTRKHILESNKWLKHRWEVLRGHKGIMKDDACPYSYAN